MMLLLMTKFVLVHLF